MAVVMATANEARTKLLKCIFVCILGGNNYTLSRIFETGSSFDFCWKKLTRCELCKCIGKMWKEGHLNGLISHSISVSSGTVF